MTLRVFTMGHSTRTVNELVMILSAHGVNSLVDVRSSPRSYRNPQFNIGIIENELAKRAISYRWLRELGGRRKGLGKNSKNTCWKSLAFRNFADYMETTSFRDGATELIRLAGEKTAAIMCAEAVYWRCHRSMISDFLKSKGVEVIHILGEKQVREHEYSQCAKIVDGKLTYH